jgi:hypothetical protein
MRIAYSPKTGAQVPLREQALARSALVVVVAPPSTRRSSAGSAGSGDTGPHDDTPRRRTKAPRARIRRP